MRRPLDNTVTILGSAVVDADAECEVGCGDAGGEIEKDDLGGTGGLRGDELFWIECLTDSMGAGGKLDARDRFVLVTLTTGEEGAATAAAAFVVDVGTGGGGASFSGSGGNVALMSIHRGSSSSKMISSCFACS